MLKEKSDISLLLLTECCVKRGIFGYLKVLLNASRLYGQLCTYNYKFVVLFV